MARAALLVPAAQSVCLSWSRKLGLSRPSPAFTAFAPPLPQVLATRHKLAAHTLAERMKARLFSTRARLAYPES